MTQRVTMMAATAMFSSESAIQIAVRLLAMGCTAATFGSGCALRLCEDVTYDLDVGPEVEIVALTSDKALDDRGRLLDFSRDDSGRPRQPSLDDPDTWHSFEQPLRDITVFWNHMLAVGDDGLIMTLNLDRHSDLRVLGPPPRFDPLWVVVPAVTPADLRSIAWLRDNDWGTQLVLIGPEVMLCFDLSGDALSMLDSLSDWRVVPEPPSGWRALRDAFYARDRVWAVGESTLWSAPLRGRGTNYVDLTTLAWTQHELVAPHEPLIGGLTVNLEKSQRELVIVFSRHEIFSFDEAEGLKSIDVPFDGELVDRDRAELFSSGGTRLVFRGRGRVRHGDPIPALASAVYREEKTNAWTFISHSRPRRLPGIHGEPIGSPTWGWKRTPYRWHDSFTISGTSDGHIVVRQVERSLRCE